MSTSITGDDPRQFGRIDEDGNVWVNDGGKERIVGGYPDGAPEDPFALYVRRYADLEATVNLFETRMATLPPRDIDQTVKVLREQLIEPPVVGDVAALRQRVEQLAEKAEAQKEEYKAGREAAKREALELRESIVAEAESLSGQDPERTQWKQSGARLRDLLEQWKDNQRKGPRLDKATEDALWKRFSAARTVFDRNRRQFFAALDERHGSVKATKEKLIKEAEALQDSEDWGPTSQAYRDLMDRWKAAGRASRKDDDSLWNRFRAAQQVFFDKRRSHDQATDAEYSKAVEAKEALLVEAEAILPITNPAEAKEQLRDIQDRWADAGRVPSRDVARLENRLRKVEDALRSAEESEWRKTNPETQARAQGMIAQLQDSIDDLQRQKDAAEAAGDAKLAAEIGDALATKEAWLRQVQSSLS